MLLHEVVTLLQNRMPLPEKYRDHLLFGDWENYKDCHILPDWILIYTIDEETSILYLARTGIHSDIFRK